MQIPIRLASALDPRRSPGMLLALGFSTLVLISTPFLLPEIGARYDVGLTVSALIGVCQLGGFAIGSWGAGRWLSPNRNVFVAALLGASAVNLASATLPPFVWLLVLRLGSGLALGTITWFAWSIAFGKREVMARVAVVGPIIGVIATPAVALVIDRYGLSALFVMLGCLAFVPLALAGTVPAAEGRERKQRRPATYQARMILVALSAFSLGGSAVYTFGVTIASRELALSASVTAIAYTGNALLSIPAAGWPFKRTIPSPWMALTACCAILVASSFSTPVFFAAVMFWGFCYWMAIPGVFSVLADVSAYPEDRAGDAQAVMAMGRVVGPLLGGFTLDAIGKFALAAVGSALMLAAAAVVLRVRINPTDVESRD